MYHDRVKAGELLSSLVLRLTNHHNNGHRQQRHRKFGKCEKGGQVSICCKQKMADNILK
jgi:hypothetical protein